jgi:hypothetical protein
MACTKNSACYLCMCGVHLLLIFAREEACLLRIVNIAKHATRRQRVLHPCT